MLGCGYMHKILSVVMTDLQITNTWLANKLDVNDSTIRYWKLDSNSRKPSKKHFKKLMDVLHKELLLPQHRGQMNKIAEEVRTLLSPGEVLEVTSCSRKAEDFILNALRIRRDGVVFNSETVESCGKTKAVVFDFDGTLTVPNNGNTIWEELWVRLGYKREECVKLQQAYLAGEITHPEWCKRTCDAFKQRGMTKSLLEDLAKEVHLLNNVEELFTSLEKNDIRIFIVSGSIKRVIREVLRGSLQHIERICANEMEFKKDGSLHKIIATPYDFETKARFVLELARELDCSTKDIVFVGNGENDTFVKQTGAVTVCMNPRWTNPLDKKIWDKWLTDCDDANKIFTCVTI